MITPLRGSKLIQIVDHANVGQSVLAQVIAYDHLCTIRLAGEYAAVSAGTGVLEIGKGGVSRSFNYQLSLLQQAYDNGIFDRVLPQYVNDWKTVHLTISREFLERVIPNELCDVFRQYTLDPAFREQFDAYAGCLEKYFSEEGTQNFYEALCDAHLPIPEHVPEKLVPRNDVVAILATDSGALNLAEQIYRDRDRLIKKNPSSRCSVKLQRVRNAKYPSPSE